MISRYDLLELVQRAIPSCRLRNLYLRLLGAKIGKNVKTKRIKFVIPIFRNLEIKDDVGIHINNIIDLSDKVYIGKSSTVSIGVYILTHQTPERHNKNVKDKLAPVRIGENVFIGARATILCGVTIGDNVIIGAGSLVNKNVPPNSLAVGVPIKIRGLR